MQKTAQESADHVRPTSWIAVAIAWLLVGLPLAWGISVTLQNAARLFQ